MQELLSRVSRGSLDILSRLRSPSEQESSAPHRCYVGNVCVCVYYFRKRPSPLSLAAVIDRRAGRENSRGDVCAGAIWDVDDDDDDECAV